MPVALHWLWKVMSSDASRLTGHTWCNFPQTFPAGVWRLERNSRKTDARLCHLPFLKYVSGRQGRETTKGGVSLTWSPGCCSDNSRLLYLLPGWALKCKYLQLQMCPFIIEQERVVEHFCQRLEVIKGAISDASKNQPVIRGRKGCGVGWGGGVWTARTEGKIPALIPLRHN